jgi:hypothetical protein
MSLVGRLFSPWYQAPPQRDLRLEVGEVLARDRAQAGPGTPPGTRSQPHPQPAGFSLAGYPDLKSWSGGEPRAIQHPDRRVWATRPLV